MPEHDAPERVSDELELCPFCGGTAGFIGSPGRGYNVQCNGCLAKGGWGDYCSQAEAAWNRRASPAPVSGVTAEMIERGIDAYREEVRADISNYEDLVKSILTAAFSLPTPSDQPAPPAPVEVTEATHRHKKRGTEYVLIGVGKMQAECWVEPVGAPIIEVQTVDMREVAIYRSLDDGSLWVRPREEFEDGRFEPLTAALQASKPSDQGAGE